MFTANQHTQTYNLINSHHPVQHNRLVVNTLLNGAQEIASTQADSERKHVIKVLWNNNYPLKFIKNCNSYHNASHHVWSNSDTTKASAASISNSLVVLPYVRDVSQKISQVLENNNVKVGFKCLNVLCARFPWPKDKPSFLLCSQEIWFTKSVAFTVI